MHCCHCLMSFCLQSVGDGPKRIPVSQHQHAILKAVVTPGPHQRVLGVSNGPQRVQRPASHQKPVSQCSVAPKPTHPSDQNVNPASQNSAPRSKQSSQHSQPETNVTQEKAKPPSELAKLEKQERTYNNTWLIHLYGFGCYI